VRELGYLGQQRRLDRLPRDEQVHRLDPTGRLDEILALDDEEAELVTPAPFPELADELQPLVVA
jgi:hypothetical protein